MGSPHWLAPEPKPATTSASAIRLKKLEREKAELASAHALAQQQLKRLTAALQSSLRRQQEREMADKKQREGETREAAAAAEQRAAEVADLRARVDALGRENAQLVGEREEAKGRADGLARMLEEMRGRESN